MQSRKALFLKLGAEAVRIARARTVDNGINYAWKAMILCGLCLDTDGVWRVSQLKAPLLSLIGEHKDLFDSVVHGTYDKGDALHPEAEPQISEQCDDHLHN